MIFFLCDPFERLPVGLPVHNLTGFPIALKPCAIMLELRPIVYTAAAKTFIGIFSHFNLQMQMDHIKNHTIF